MFTNNYHSKSPVSAKGWLLSNISDKNDGLRVYIGSANQLSEPKLPIVDVIKYLQ